MTILYKKAGSLWSLFLLYIEFAVFVLQRRYSGATMQINLIYFDKVIRRGIMKKIKKLLSHIFIDGLSGMAL